MSETGNAAVDQAGIDFLQFFVTQTEFIHDAGTIIFDQDIRVGYQFTKDFLAPL